MLPSCPCRFGFPAVRYAAFTPLERRVISGNLRACTRVFACCNRLNRPDSAAVNKLLSRSRMPARRCENRIARDGPTPASRDVCVAEATPTLAIRREQRHPVYAGCCSTRRENVTRYIGLLPRPLLGLHIMAILCLSFCRVEERIDPNGCFETSNTTRRSVRGGMKLI